jgi:hypothetical protein
MTSNVSLSWMNNTNQIVSCIRMINTLSVFLDYLEQTFTFVDVRNNFVLENSYWCTKRHQRNIMPFQDMPILCAQQPGIVCDYQCKTQMQPRHSRYKQ